MNPAQLDLLPLEDYQEYFIQPVAHFLSAYFSLDPDLADYFSQGAVLELRSNLAQIKSFNDRAIMSCLKSIARHRTLDYFRSNKRYFSIEQDLAHEDAAQEDDWPLSVQDEELAWDCLIDLKLLLREMPAAQRQVISMHARGFSNREIAAVLKVSEPRISQLLNKAQGCLRTLFED